MSDLESGVLQNIIADALIATSLWLLTLAAVLLLHGIRRRKLLRTFGVTREHRTFTVYLSSVVVRPYGSVGFDGTAAAYYGAAVPDYELNAVVPVVDLWSAGRLERLSVDLRERVLRWWILLPVKPEIRTSPRTRAELHHGGAVLSVGSGAYNSCTDYLDSLNPRILIADGGLAVRRQTSSGVTISEWRFQAAGAGATATDFGLLRKQVDVATDTTYIIAAGLGIVGTTGALHYLAAKHRELYKRYKQKEFEICLKFADADTDPNAIRRGVAIYQSPI